MGQTNQEPRWKYWATRSSVLLFARTASSLALYCPLRARTPLRSLVCKPAYFVIAHSLARGTVNDWMAIFSVFFLFWTTVHWEWAKLSERETPLEGKSAMKRKTKEFWKRNKSCTNRKEKWKARKMNWVNVVQTITNTWRHALTVWFLFRSSIMVFRWDHWINFFYVHPVP